MIRRNANWWFEVYVYRLGEDGAKITKYRDSGGEMLMAKDVGERSGTAKSHLGVTLNLGNFESLRVDVGVEFPCDPDGLHAAIDEAYAIAEDKLIEKVQLIKEKF